MTESELALVVTEIDKINLNCYIKSGSIDGRIMGSGRIVGENVTMVLTVRTYWHNLFLKRSLMTVRPVYVYEGNRLSV